MLTGIVICRISDLYKTLWGIFVVPDANTMSHPQAMNAKVSTELRLAGNVIVMGAVILAKAYPLIYVTVSGIVIPVASHPLNNP